MIVMTVKWSLMEVSFGLSMHTLYSHVGSQVNPNYTSTFVFNNDFPALLEEVPAPPEAPGEELLRWAPARGCCRVMCFHPKTSSTLPTMTQEEVKDVVDRLA